MKKFWKIKFNSDTKQSLEYLSVDREYILIVMNKTSDIMGCRDCGEVNLRKEKLKKLNDTIGKMD